MEFKFDLKFDRAPPDTLVFRVYTLPYPDEQVGQAWLAQGHLENAEWYLSRATICMDNFEQDARLSGKYRVGDTPHCKLCVCDLIPSFPVNVSLNLKPSISQCSNPMMDSFEDFCLTNFVADCELHETIDDPYHLKVDPIECLASLGASSLTNGNSL